MGSAVNQTARQIGGAFGVAILVVILGAPGSAQAALASTQRLWLYCALMATLSGVAAIGIGRRPAPAPAVPAPERAADLVGTSAP